MKNKKVIMTLKKELKKLIKENYIIKHKINNRNIFYVKNNE